MNLTGVVLTKNEEKNIEECIKSLSFCDEVIVIDDNSTDKTVSLANKNGAKVFKRALNNDFAAQRNFALNKAKNDWVLYIDADERVSSELKKEIKSVLDKDSNAKGYYIKRKDVLWGKEIKYGEIGSTKLLRLAKKNSGKWERSVHENWVVKGDVSDLRQPIIHYAHQNISDFIKHIEFFSSVHAKENLKEGKKASIIKIIFMPMAHFTRNYFIRLGVLDGIEGFILAILMSFHSFLAWSKMYIIQKDE